MALRELWSEGTPGLSEEVLEDGTTIGRGARILRRVLWALNVLVSVLLNLVVTKLISIFVWRLYARANRTTFHGREELARRVNRARRAGRPVLFASNHLSMFDDPVIPMALFRTGPRAIAEFSCLAILLILWQLGPPALVAPEIFAASVIAYAMGISLMGARKTWWSTGDLVNFSGASSLRGKMEYGRRRPLSLPARVMLAVADPVIHLFMMSATVKTVLVDRRPGDDRSGSSSKGDAPGRPTRSGRRAGGSAG
jgi:hypothetical protein